MLPAGGVNITSQFIKAVTHNLRRFDKVTVREKEGIEICSLAGRNDVIQVLDRKHYYLVVINIVLKIHI